MQQFNVCTAFALTVPHCCSC